MGWDYARANDSRRHHRFEQPELSVTLGDAAGNSLNWSLGGLAIRCAAGLPPDLAVGASVSGRFSRPEAEAVEFSGRVVRVEAKASLLAVEFGALSEAAFLFFGRLFQGMGPAAKGT